ncbi:MAG: phosphotransferase, partial [Acidimicrobiales bacterium]
MSTPVAQDGLAHVGQVLSDNWGIEAVQTELLAGEHDATLRVVDADGVAHCVKVRTLGDDASDVDLELAVFEHLRHHDPIDVPRLRPTLDGADRCVVDGRAVWVLSWVDGLRWADVVHRGPRLARDLGEAARRLSRGLQSFEHPGASRTHHWDLRSIDSAIARHSDQLTSERQRAVGERALELFADRVEPRIERLPQSIVHQDLNDHNVIVSVDQGLASIAGIIDFGDLLHSATITELAVPIAYAMLRTSHPIDTAANVAAGWFGDETPTEDELAVLFPLALGRLVVNATTWAARQAHQPGYARLRSANTWATLDQLLDYPIEFVDERIAAACNLIRPSPIRAMPAPRRSALYSGLAVADLDPHRDVFDVVDPTDSDAVTRAALPDLPCAIVHDTVRLDLGGPADGEGGPSTIQLGVELRLNGATELPLPAPGSVVESTPDRVVVAHRIDQEDYWTMWSGLHSTAVPGDWVAEGEPIGSVPEEPGSAINVQLLRFGPSGHDHVPSMVRPVDREAWTRLSIDPSELLGLTTFDRLEVPTESEVMAVRDGRLASSQRYYYREPMSLVRASGVWFVDTNA